MRTSASQFQLLVEYMERYGDLSKPTEGPQGRATNIQRWAELAEMLNADATGDVKTADKWRKVWSDFKNNIKKKAARIHRAALGTGGGPACTLKLTDLEQKVLSIVGTQAATGIVHIPEIGLEIGRLEEVVTGPPPPEINSNISLIEQINEVDDTNTAMEDWNRPGTSARSPTFPPSHVPSQSGETGLALAGETPPLPSSSAQQRAQQSPTPLPLTPRRRRGRLIDPCSPSRRRTRTQTQSELARQTFVRSDCEWRAFEQKTEQERIRIRQLELKSEERWQDLLGQFLILGNRIIDVLEKKNRDNSNN